MPDPGHISGVSSDSELVNCLSYVTACLGTVSSHLLQIPNSLLIIIAIGEMYDDSIRFSLSASHFQKYGWSQIGCFGYWGCYCVYMYFFFAFGSHNENLKSIAQQLFYY